jgi:hypothetical protein
MSEEILGYDKAGDTSEVFRSPEGAAAIKEAVGKMQVAAESAGAVTVTQRRVEKASPEYDPTGIDPENGHPGVIVDKTTGISQPKLETSVWRTFVGPDKTSAFEWKINKPEGNPDAAPMISLESPFDIPIGDFSVPLGVRDLIEGRRIQEYIIGDDGVVHGRSNDYTVAGDVYRVGKGSQLSWEATENEVAFLRSGLAAAELVQLGKTIEKPIIGSEVSPEIL